MKGKINAYLKDKLYVNASYLISGTLISSVFGFFFWTLVARLYTHPEQIGLASTIISSMILLATLSTLGFDIALIRFLPGTKHKNKKINSCLTLAGITSLLISLLFILTLNFWSPRLLFIKENLNFSIFFILFALITTLLVLINSVFVSQRSSKYILEGTLIFSSLKLLFPFFLVGLGAFGIFLSWGLATLIAVLILISVFIYKILPEYKLNFTIDKNSVNEMLRFSFANYLGNIFFVLPGLLLPLMITTLISPEMTAYFYISWMIAAILGMVPFLTSKSLLAESSHNLREMRENFKKSTKFIALLLIPGVIFLILMSEKVLLLFGQEYAKNAALPLKIFSLATLPQALNILFITLKNLEKKVRSVVIINGLVALLTLSLSYFAIIRNFGLEGIAFSWLIAQLIVSLGVLFSRPSLLQSSQKPSPSPPEPDQG